MLTLTKRSLIVTDAPTAAERALMQQHADGADVAGQLAVVQTRITVSALNTLQYGRYEAARRQVAAWAQARAGAATWEETIASVEGQTLIEAGLRWARAQAAVTAVETRTANRVTDAATDWQAVEWPQLGSIDAYADETPGDLTDALDALIFDTNPGLFRLAAADSADAKKNGGISAG
jgi:hypothetical protein